MHHFKLVWRLLFNFALCYNKGDLTKIKTMEYHMRNVLEDMDRCVGCSACAQRCPTQCISMQHDHEGFLVPYIDANRCVDCGQCKKVCPVLNTGMEIPNANQEPGFPRAWAAWSLNDAIRLSSSSGGIFSLLAESCLSRGGTVFGAAFDQDFMVRHTGITEPSELDSLRRSKYVQSDINQCFREAEKLLKAHKPVLFSGTGCQIAGLKSFLGKDYPDLLTVDLACYGVPSPRVWSLYLEDMKKRFKSEIEAISFRDKKNGWKHYCMHISFKNGRSYRDAAVKDPFFIGFGKNLFSRKSCYNCLFKHPHSRADITLADFWGADKLGIVNTQDDKGISLVIANTPRGQAALEAIRENCFLVETSFREATSKNPRLTVSAPMPHARTLFFEDMNSGMHFSSLKRKYMNRFVQNFKLMARKILGSGMVDRLRKLLRG